MVVLNLLPLLPWDEAVLLILGRWPSSGPLAIFKWTNVCFLIVVFRHPVQQYLKMTTSVPLSRLPVKEYMHQRCERVCLQWFVTILILCSMKVPSAEFFYQTREHGGIFACWVPLYLMLIELQIILLLEIIISVYI